MHTKKLLIFIGLLWASVSTLAQDMRQYSFTHYGAVEGLISNEATSVLHDNDGFIWVGTNNGIQRYDGSRFISFRHDKDNPRSIPANYVQQMLKDAQGNIWVLCGEGLVARLDPRRMEFTTIPQRYRSQLHKMHVKKLVKDDRDNIFLVAALLEYITWDKEKDEFSPDKNPFLLPGERKPLDMAYQASANKYWISTNQGLVVYNANTGQLSYAGNNTENEAILNQYDSYIAINLFFDRNGRLWYDTWKDGQAFSNCFDLRKKQFVIRNYSFGAQLLTYYEPHGYMQQRDGTIWIRGLYILGQFQEKENRFQLVYNGYVNEQSIVYEKVSSFCEDNDSNIWIATTNNGLYRFAPSEQFFTNIRHINRRTNLPGKGGVLSFVRLPDGDILTGTWGDGLYRYDSAFNHRPLGLPGIAELTSPTVWDMDLSRDGNTIWMGMQPGVGEYNWREKKFKNHNPAILKHRTVRQIEEDRFGNLWLGMQAGGLFKWDARRGAARFEDGIHKFDSIPDCSIGKIFRDSKGYIWVGTIGYGVYVIDPAIDKVVLQLPAIDGDEKYTKFANVHHVMEYNDTTMILAGGSSIHIFNRITRTVRTIGNENSITGSISSVEKDASSGYLWVSGSQGLYRVNIFNRIFIHFNRIDGISDDRFLISSSYKLPDGRLLFGADNQFTVFQPRDVRINNVAPPITITGFRVNERFMLVDSLLQLKRVELTPKENSITIDFSGLSYAGAYLIRYRMKGVDDDWRIADKHNQAVYTYLPPGEYVFMVKAEDADGKESMYVTQLPIKIYPHFWQTWWFYGMLLLFGASVLYWIDRERIRRLKELQRVRSEIANNLHADVTTTLSNINLLGEMAKIKADKDIDRSKEYIDQISAKSHAMIIAMDDILWSIDPDNDSMEKTLLRMMEFTDALRNRYAANIELIVDKKVESLNLNMKTRHEFFLVFKEGLKLIVELAGGKNTLVQIDFFRKKLSLKIQDSTASLDENVAEIDTVIENINDRTSGLNGESDIQYDKNGIAVVVMVPV